MEILNTVGAIALLVVMTIGFAVMVKLAISETKHRNAKEAAKERFYEKLTERLSE